MANDIDSGVTSMTIENKEVSPSVGFCPGMRLKIVQETLFHMFTACPTLAIYGK
jgi:hypothetical protein